MRFVVDIHYQTSEVVLLVQSIPARELWSTSRRMPYGTQQVIRYQADNTANDHGTTK